MARCIGGFAFSSLIAILAVNLMAAEQPAVKSEQPAAKKVEAAAENGKQPAAKSAEPKATKGAADSSTLSSKDKGKSPAGQTGGGSQAEQAAKAKQPAAKEKAASPATYAVKKGPFKITVNLDGTFEAKKSREIIIKPEEWSSLVVETAVPHGERGPRGRRAADARYRED